ncbi:hypothetical protein, partial [Brachybacterium paraconglomeratum]|uniref:hypothetical protein n=1 Tax=Brachybacterium paraconglomeratum TaxID=173362 RepID=UPI0021A60623
RGLGLARRIPAALGPVVVLEVRDSTRSDGCAEVKGSGRAGVSGTTRAYVMDMMYVEKQTHAPVPRGWQGRTEWEALCPSSDLPSSPAASLRS